MSEPTLPPPPQQPFAPTPRPTSSGCGRAALVGCGVLLLLLGIAAVFFVVKAKSLLGWSMNKMKDEIVRKLPPDVTDAEREQLESAFAAASRKATEGEIDPAALQRLQRQIVGLAQGELTRERVIEVTRELEAIAAGDAPPAEAPADDGDAEAPQEGPVGGESDSPPPAPLVLRPAPAALLAA